MSNSSKKLKTDTIISDADILLLRQTLINLGYYKTAFIEHDTFSDPLDVSNPIRSLYYLFEQEDPAVSLFRCANSECQIVFTYHKSLTTARRHALLHFQKYVEGPALLQVQEPKVSMLAATPGWTGK